MKSIYIILLISHVIDNYYLKSNLNEITLSGSPCRGPSIDKFSDGNFIISYYCKNNLTSSNFIKISSNCEILGNQQNLAVGNDFSNRFLPWVKTLPDNRFIITYELEISNGKVLYLQFFDSNGNKINNPIQVSSSIEKNLNLNSSICVSDSKIIVIWSYYDKIKYQKFNFDGSKDGINEFVDINSSNQTYAKIVNLIGNNFAITWTECIQSDCRSYVKLFDGNEKKILIDSSTFDQQPVICNIKNIGFAISWTGFENNMYTTYYSIFNYDGTTFLTKTKITDINSNREYPTDIKYLNRNLLVIGFTSDITNDFDVYFLVVDLKGLIKTKPIKANLPIINSISSNNQQRIKLGIVNEKNIIAIWVHDPLPTYIKMNKFTIRGCYDFEINNINQSKIDFTNLLVDEQIVIIKSLPINGILKNDLGSILPNIEYSKNTLYYFKTINNDLDYFTYIIDQSDIECKVTINNYCSFSCKSCTDKYMNNVYDYNCKQCSPDYYPQTNNGFYNCYTKDTKLDNYYFNTFSNKFENCNIACRTCSIFSTNDNNNCISCNTGYNKIIDIPSICTTNSPISYFLKDSIYNRCHPSCKICENMDDCLECKSSYYLYPDSKKCISKDTIINGYNYFSGSLTRNKIGFINQTDCKVGHSKILEECKPFSDAIIGYYFNFINKIFELCYTSCQSCRGYGNEENHNCIICKTGYYKLEDNDNMCYNLSLEGYYLSGTIYKKCYKSCKRCSAQGDYINHNCLECNIDYYMINDNNKLCFRENEIIEYYYFDSDSLTFNKCGKECKYCLNSYKCLQCNMNYFPLIDKPYSCNYIDQVIEGYYLDVNVFKLCYQSCLSCNKQGDNMIHNCITCKSNYFKKFDNPDNCYKEDVIIPYYYLDKNVFNKCYESCLICSSTGDINDHKCKKCKNNYYFKIDKSSDCFLKDTIIEDYYFDNKILIFLKCYESCKYCLGHGNINFHNCKICKENYYNLYNNNLYCFDIYNYPKNYVFDIYSKSFKNKYVNSS